MSLFKADMLALPITFAKQKRDSVLKILFLPVGQLSKVIVIALFDMVDNKVNFINVFIVYIT